MNARPTFTPADYVALLDAVAEGGYRPTSFLADDGGDGALLLRHDIDKSIADARAIAELEFSRGIRSAFFFLLRSPLYSLLEPESVVAVRDIAAMGHDIGLHCDLHRVPESLRGGDIDATVVREVALLESILGMTTGGLVSFHNPPREVICRAPETGAYVSAYDPKFMLPHTKYISDSNAFWREGDPRQMLRTREWPRLQILVHPFWWASPAASDTTSRLRAVVNGRAGEIDRYLRYSNDLWRAYRGEEPLCTTNIE